MTWRLWFVSGRDLRDRARLPSTDEEVDAEANGAGSGESDRASEDTEAQESVGDDEVAEELDELPEAAETLPDAMTPGMGYGNWNGGSTPAAHSSRDIWIK